MRIPRLILMAAVLLCVGPAAAQDDSDLSKTRVPARAPSVSARSGSNS